MEEGDAPDGRAQRVSGVGGAAWCAELGRLLMEGRKRADAEAKEHGRWANAGKQGHAGSGHANWAYSGEGRKRGEVGRWMKTVGQKARLAPFFQI